MADRGRYRNVALHGAVTASMVVALSVWLGQYGGGVGTVLLGALGGATGAVLLHWTSPKLLWLLTR